ncbi:glutamine synthetase family protein [Vibrio hippocampi]|uniref:Gamma-glutamylputrescine synthetase PuuA n=1 Tax=Vibrio hippocampi TaxID=654686 RepID=A0ABM8ZMT2_9VIBR|nr:glutamine synthetase family protein [Vibrio hippocampi]CAH0529826.1 Gamma-glutamylputrescine synthetase PuuA [Vibrio hippocampi]
MDMIKEWILENRITEVECLVPDITGNARGKIIPAHKFLRDKGMKLPESLFFQTITGDWPDDDEMIDLTDSDMNLKPDEKSIRFVPWAKEPTAQVIHDCFVGDDEYVDIAPRSVLRRVLQLYKDKGLTPIVAPELEFYLVKKNIDEDFPLEPPIGRNGRPETARQSFSIDAVNEFDPLFEEMYDFCDAQKLDVDTLVHESGAAQMEINFDHGDALELADQAFLFKRTVRETALRHDVYATFMAKPMQHEPGSSMHIHQSMLDREGKNIFSNADGSNSQALLHYIGGLQTFAPASIAFMAPNVNSYRRLIFGECAPGNLEWGEDNRTVGIRVPASDAKARRVENRYAGADVNPYLAMAVSLACGYLGLVNEIEPRDKVTTDISGSPYSLPHTLEEALSILEQCVELREILGERFVSAYVSIKRKEYETFFQVISSWEREFLLLNV